jgi:hypothetical protein
MRDISGGAHSTSEVLLEEPSNTADLFIYDFNF